METFQFLILIVQIMFLMVVLYPAYWLITKLTRAFVKTTRKTKTSIFG